MGSLFLLNRFSKKYSIPFIPQGFIRFGEVVLPTSQNIIFPMVSCILGRRLGPRVGGKVEIPTGGGVLFGPGPHRAKMTFLSKSLISKGGIIKGNFPFGFPVLS